MKHERRRRRDGPEVENPPDRDHVVSGVVFGVVFGVKLTVDPATAPSSAGPLGRSWNGTSANRSILSLSRTSYTDALGHLRER